MWLVLLQSILIRDQLFQRMKRKINNHLARLGIKALESTEHIGNYYIQ